MNFSLKYKCKQPGHSIHHIEALCLSPSCTSKNRLLCAKCVAEQHQSHVKNCVFIDDLMAKEIMNVPNFSDPLISAKITEVESRVQAFGSNYTVIDDIDRLFSALQCIIFDKINRCREILRNIINRNKNINDEIYKDLNLKFNRFYNPEDLVSAIHQQSKKEITLKELNEQVTLFFKSEDRKDLQRELENSNKKRMRIYPEINSLFIKHSKECLVEMIKELKGILYTPGAWGFIIPKIPNGNTSIKVIKENHEFHFNNQDSQQYLQSSEALKGPGVHTWVIRILEYPPDIAASLYIGVICDNKKDDINYIFQQGFSCYTDIVNIATIPYFELKAGKISASQVIKNYFTENKDEDNNNKKDKYFNINFTLDLNKKKLLVFDDNKEFIQKYSKKRLQKVSRPNFNLQQNQLNFWSKNMKYRPMVVSYSSKIRIAINP